MKRGDKVIQTGNLAYSRVGTFNTVQGDQAMVTVWNPRLGRKVSIMVPLSSVKAV
jgi:hypothetical protein